VAREAGGVDQIYPDAEFRSQNENLGRKKQRTKRKFDFIVRFRRNKRGSETQFTSDATRGTQIELAELRQLGEAESLVE